MDALVQTTELWDKYHYGLIDKKFLINERFRYLLEKIGCDKGQNTPNEMNIEYLDFLSKQPSLVEGALELVDYLRGKYRLGILSNGFKGTQAQKMKSGRIDNYFDLMVLSDDINITKPLKGIFDYALSQGGYSKDETLMIGDNYDVDILGAKNAGWSTIFFNKRNKEIDDNISNFTVEKLIDIKSIL